ncbi:hypothetical protein L5515_004014 [Caenorhabditis briggsae]|uniref:Uncharacterized protein n=1 Tax=Caenorhabditis briggsae TaxID=6238 RepID=A0AAE9EKY4_CAEBR|nr:hypothetical protein L5515_004014 [Caenorhabditis briggsae]
MPKGGATSLVPVSAGLRTDLDTFLKSFLQLKTIRFTDYKKLFEHLRMINLYNGRSESAEIIEFNEQLLIHCLPYIEEKVCPGIPRSLEERLFGLYSLYTFFYTQPVDHVVKIRIDPDTCLSFRKLTDLVLRENILEAYMICLKLHEDKAFRHVAFIQTFDPSLFKRFGAADQDNKHLVYTNHLNPYSRIKALTESDLFQKLRIISQEYNRLKIEAGLNFGNQSPNLDF